MNSNLVGGIVKSAVETNMQSSLHSSGKYIREADVDSKLAIAYYRFLMGHDNRVPSYDYINKLLSQALNQTDEIQANIDIWDDIEEVRYSDISRSKLISMGGSVKVYYYAPNNKPSLIIQFETPIENPVYDSIARIDTISSDDHTAYYTYLTGPKTIDVDQKVLFQKGRIKFLQEYLKNYSLSLEQSENTKSK